MATVSRPRVVPAVEASLTVPHSSLFKVFDAVNNFPRSSARAPVHEMEGTKFHRLLRDLDLLGPNLTTLDVDFILLKSKPRGAKRLTLTQFGVAIEAVAERLGIAASDIINKAIELGCPLPSAPPRPEWKQISPHLLSSHKHDSSCRCHRDSETGWHLEGGIATQKEHRLLGQSQEWRRIKEEMDAVRRRYGVLGPPEDLQTWNSAGKRREGRSASLTSGTAFNAGRGLGISSEGKVQRGKACCGVLEQTPAQRVKASNGPLEQTPVGKGGPKESESSSPVTPFVIAEGDASSPGQDESSFRTPETERATNGESALDLFGAFSLFCSMSPHKENEPGMIKSQPLMNGTEFRKLCRDCDLRPQVASAPEHPDVIFHVVTARAKTKYMDFDLFLSALERLALSCHLSFSEMERVITSTAVGLQAMGGPWPVE